MLPGYMDGIVEAGGTPLMLPLTLDDEMLAQLMALCDGFPSDGRTRRIAGALRGDADQSLRRCCPARDAMEQSFLRWRLKKTSRYLVSAAVSSFFKCGARRNTLSGSAAAEAL